MLCANFVDGIGMPACVAIRQERSQCVLGDIDDGFEFQPSRALARLNRFQPAV